MTQIHGRKSRVEGRTKKLKMLVWKARIMQPQAKEFWQPAEVEKDRVHSSVITWILFQRY